MIHCQCGLLHYIFVHPPNQNSLCYVHYSTWVGNMRTGSEHEPIPVRFSICSFCRGSVQPSPSFSFISILLSCTDPTLLVVIMCFPYGLHLPGKINDRNNPPSLSPTHSFIELFSLETQYQLSAMGLNVQELPESSSGTVKTKNHLQWMKTRRIIDAARESYRQQQKELYNMQQQHHPTYPHHYHAIQQQPTPPLSPTTTTAALPPVSVYDTFGCVVHPGVEDVIFSQGGRKQKNWGNQDYQHFVASRVDAYYKTHDRKERRQMRTEIIDLVQSRNGRFLGRVVVNNSNNIGDTTGCLGTGGDFFVVVEDVEDLHNRISKSIYEHHRNDSAHRNVQRIKCVTAKFTGLDDGHHKRRKVVDEDGNLVTPMSSRLCGECL